MSEHPFRKLTAGNKEALEAYSADRFEQTKVLFTIKQAGERFKREMSKIHEVAQKQDNFLLTFRLFNQTFPTFPFRLYADSLQSLKAPLHELPGSAFPNWFKTFTALPVVSMFADIFGTLTPREQQEKPMALIFPRKGFKQGLVIHNGSDDYVPEGTSCMMFVGESRHGKKHHPRLFVQPYVNLLDAIYAHGRGWRPD